MAEMLKEVANRYKVLATLGEGGMGTVYLVEDSTNGQQVALKVLLGKTGMDANMLLQFKQEFRVMAKLRHPNNCEVYDYGLLPDGTPYFTMEVVPGKGLDEMIPVGPDELTNILSQICQALGYIHQQGFVHCDLKPENVRVKPDGTVKLMDFGLMEVAGSSGGAIKGTLAYIAPEVAKRDRIDQRSDIYSLGAVTYQLLTGETPFKGATPIEVLRAHLNQQPASPRELNAAIPTIMEQVVLKMMAKEPIARFQSAYDVLTALGIEVAEGMGASLLASAFVGRQAEVSRLTSALQAVKRDRQGGNLWVAGSAGAGKSRLLGEFRFAVQLEEIPFLMGTCSEQKAPYGVFIEVLRALLPVAKEACPEALAEHAPVLSRLVPEMSDGRQAPPMEPEQEKMVLQTAITDLVFKAADKAGAVMVLEDWDKADPLSADVLNYMLRNAGAHPLLVVGTCRSKDAAKGDTLDLPTLTQSEMTEMVKSMLGVTEFPAGLAGQLYELTAGNPQFVTNLLDHLLRTSVLEKSKGKWQLPEALAPEDLPTDVKDLLLERFAALSAPALQVAHLAAILGGSFDLKIATDLLGLGEDALFDALDELLQAKILMSEDRHYSFATAELKEALYGHLPIETRVALHTAVAEYMEAALAAVAEPELQALTTMAQHFLKSRHTEKAVRYALKAAQANREIMAIDTAMGLVEAGWEILSQFEDANTWNPVKAQYHNMLGVAYTAKSKFDAADEHLEKGLALAESLGAKEVLLELLANRVQYYTMRQSAEGLAKGVELYDRIKALATETGNTRTLVRSANNVGRCLFFSGQNARAQEVFEQAVDIAKAANIPYFLARSLCLLGYFRATGGEATREEGYRNLAEAVAIQQTNGDKFGLGYTRNIQASVQLVAGRFRDALESARNHGDIMAELGLPDDQTIALLNQAIALYEMGDLDAALEVGDHCFDMAQKAGSKMGKPICLAVLASTNLRKGNLKKAEEQIRESQELARGVNNYVYSLVIPNVIEAWLYLGRLQDALGAAQEARDLVSSTGNTEIETRLWVTMGEIHARLGEEPAARSYFERARDHAAKGDELHILARAEKGLGWMAIAGGNTDAAEAHLNKAFSLSRQIPLRFVEAECYYLQGALALERNQPGEALGCFEEAVSIAQELGAPDLESLALHGASKSTDKPAQAKELLATAKTRQAILLESLSDEEAESFLSFMERAQLKRDEGSKGASAIAPVEAQAALAEEATGAERTEWLTKELAAAVQANQAETQRLATIAKEFEVLKEKGVNEDRIAELEAQNRRMEQLMRFSMAVSNVQDLEKVLEQAVDFIVEITAAERGFLLFFENGQIRSQVSRVNVDRRSPMDWQFSKSIAEKVLTTGEVVCVFDALSDTQFNQAKSVVDLNLRTVICVPMRIKGKMIGAIYVDRQSINENFGPSDLELVMSLAAQAASAIENARLHQEWVDKSKRLELLNHLSKTISGSLEMEEVLDLIVKMTLEVSRAERGFLFMLDDDRRRLICRAARDGRGSLPLDEDHEISQSICTKVLQTGEAENVADAMNDEEFQFQQSIMALNLRMVMCVPIFAKGEIIGLLYVDSQAVVNAFSDKDLELLLAIAGHASVAIENARLHARTMKLADDLRATFYSFVQALGTSIDAKHPLTAGHSWRVTEYSVRLARKIGLPDSEIENIRIAGLLHDVGKIGTPDHILMKPGSFTNEEYEIMKRHVVHSKEILDTIHFPEGQRHIPEMAGAHHEKWDGKGYPNGTAGEDIPLGGRILALGDVFDAITSKRDYREAMPLSQALGIIRNGIGTHFDPALAPAFIEMIEEQGVIYHERDLQPPAEPQAQESNA